MLICKYYEKLTNWKCKMYTQNDFTDKKICKNCWLLLTYVSLWLVRHYD